MRLQFNVSLLDLPYHKGRTFLWCQLLSVRSLSPWQPQKLDSPLREKNHGPWRSFDFANSLTFCLISFCVWFWIQFFLKNWRWVRMLSCSWSITSGRYRRPNRWGDMEMEGTSWRHFAGICWKRWDIKDIIYRKFWYTGILFNHSIICRLTPSSRVSTDGFQQKLPANCKTEIGGKAVLQERHKWLTNRTVLCRKLSTKFT